MYCTQQLEDFSGQESVPPNGGGQRWYIPPLMLVVSGGVFPLLLVSSGKDPKTLVASGAFPHNIGGQCAPLRSTSPFKVHEPLCSH